VQPYGIGGSGAIGDGHRAALAGGGEHDADGQADSAQLAGKMNLHSPHKLTTPQCSQHGWALKINLNRVAMVRLKTKEKLVRGMLCRAVTAVKSKCSFRQSRYIESSH
jgi:hypothetical protein